MRPYAAARVSVAVVLVAAAGATAVLWRSHAVTHHGGEAAQAAQLVTAAEPEATSPPSVEAATRVEEPPPPTDAELATFVLDRCLLELALDGHIIYRGKPRCRNAESTLRILIPPSRAVHLRKTYHAHYGNGDIWVEHDDAWWIPLASRHYRVWDFVEVEGFVSAEHSLLVGDRREVRYLRLFPGRYDFVTAPAITMTFIPES